MQSLAIRASDPARGSFRVRMPRASPRRAAVPRGDRGLRRGRRVVSALADPPGAPSPSQSSRFTFTDDDLSHVLHAAELSHGSDGLVQPHPRSGCVMVDAAGTIVARTFQMGQGGVRSEVLAARDAGERAEGGVAYLNLEPTHGPVVGEDAAVDALVRSRVSRVVVGIAHPVPGVRGCAVAALRDAGIRVDFLGEFTSRFTSAADERAASAVAEGIARCRDANRHLLHRVATGRPFSVFKYAMTIDGKIATTSGHSAWVTGPAARQQVWAERARSDAVVVGGTTVRRDNPNLTTRRDDGHRPARVVLSRTMDLPGTEDANYGLGTGDEEDADASSALNAKENQKRKPRTNLWNTDEAATIVMTERGCKPEFQAELRALGVEVVEFDVLTPGAVADYCARRGYLQLFWECGGGLAGPALSDGVFHHVMAFVAPKIVGACDGPAPSPVGETGLERMTDALALRGLGISKHGRDVLITGYLPPGSSTGVLAETAKSRENGEPNDSSTRGEDAWTEDPLGVVEAAVAVAAERESERAAVPGDAMRFYKSWDVNGALSNFSPHPVDAPAVWGESQGAIVEWPTVEHFYQAQKFSGVDDVAATEAMEAIRAASSPEEAARIGRTLQRTRPSLIRRDWDACKEGVMRAALCAKLTRHAAPRNLLMGSRDAGQMVREDSPTDAVWGVGRDGSGKNLLGRLLMELRDDELNGCPVDVGASDGSVAPGLSRLLRRISDKFG